LKARNPPSRICCFSKLYLSLYFKANRDSYYELLQRVRTDGDWEAWLDFFLRGVIETTEQATNTAKKIMGQFTADRTKVEALGRPAASALRVYAVLQKRAPSPFRKQRNNWVSASRRLPAPLAT